MTAFDSGHGLSPDSSSEIDIDTEPTPDTETRTVPRAGGTGVTTIDGRRVAYRRAGTTGPPVVLCHGGGIDDATLTWRYVIDALAEDYRVYAPDWPGYGASDDGIDHTTERYVSILERFVERVGIDEPITLAGLSMGGAAALGFTLAHPDQVERLVLVDSYGLGREIPAGSLWKTLAHVPGANAVGWSTLGLSPASARFGLGAVVADARSLSSDFVEGVSERARKPGAGRAFEDFQRNELAPDGTALSDFSADLETLSVPTLLVHGREDPLFPVRWSERAADRLPDAHLEVLDNCGHWPPRERPDRFVDVLLAFLDRTVSSVGT